MRARDCDRSSVPNLRALKSAVILPVSQLGIGGGEATVAIAAKVLEEFGTVDILSGKEDLTPASIYSYFGVELKKTSARVVEFGNERWCEIKNPVRRLRTIQACDAEVMSGFDVIMSLSHSYPPFNVAPHGILHVLYPADSPLHLAPRAPKARTTERVKRAINRAYYRIEIAERLASYSVLTANSQFTAGWASRRWGGRGWEVWHPPVTMVASTGLEVADRGGVVAVGRFVHEGHKRQLEMVRWWKNMAGGSPRLGAMTIVGTCSARPGDPEYLDRVREEASGCSVEFIVNSTLSNLHHVYRSSKVFWHAMGYDVGDEHPELCEHFGMTTVEAMSAGCVPIVIDKGGQAEIVEHGVSGFRWKTPAELIEYTEEVLADTELWSRMSAAAVLRAQQFSRDMFEKRLRCSVASSFNDRDIGMPRRPLRVGRLNAFRR
jgi:glycosyltransferase involved in cell wall biosynthesis